MKKTIVLLLCLASILHCKQEEKRFDIESEPLSIDAALKASTWIGYKDFSYELKNVIDHFYKTKTLQNNGKLLSASQAVLYSMPNDLRNEMMNEKALALVDLTKSLYAENMGNSEDTTAKELQNLVSAYNDLNSEINDLFSN